jgi:zinc transport system permease protein
MSGISFSDIPSLFGYQFMQYAIVGGMLAAATCAAIGLFMLLRREALIGEGIAHVSFGGIALGLFIGVYPIYTALLLSIIATLSITWLRRKGIANSDAAIGIVVAFGLSLGLVLLSLSGGFNVDLFSYLFGSILTIDIQDLSISAALAIGVLAFLGALHKEVLSITFDEKAARVSGIPVEGITIAFNILVAFTVALSIKIIGILLVTALLILPGVAAMQLRLSFRGTMAFAVAASAVSVILGVVISAAVDVATSAVIIFVSMAVAAIAAIYSRLGDSKSSRS